MPATSVPRAYASAEAEALIREALPDVVLLDWMLPDESRHRASRAGCAPTGAPATSRSSC